MDHEGNVFLCCHTRNCEETKIGNFLDMSFNNIQKRRMEHYLCRRCSFYYRKNNNIAISSFISKMQSKNTLTQKIRNMFFIITKNQEEFIRQSNLFDPIFYIKHNYDAAIDNTDPLHHYMTIGAKRGSNPNEWFDSNRYLARNPDVQDYCMNPFYHYLRYGIKENRDL